MAERPPSELLDEIAHLPGAPRIVLPEDADLARDAHVDALASQLLQRFREHDDARAFELLVRLTQPRLTRLARRTVRELRPGVEAEDLVAGFFARLFTDLRRGQPPVRNVLGLGYTILRNEALNQLRRQRRAEARGRAWQALRAGECEPDPIVLADDREQSEHAARLAALVAALAGAHLAGLPERDRRALEARELAGQSYEELAVTLRLPRGQVGMVVLRARRRFAARLQESLASRPAHAPRRAGGRP